MNGKDVVKEFVVYVVVCKIFKSDGLEGVNVFWFEGLIEKIGERWVEG